MQLRQFRFSQIAAALLALSLSACKKSEVQQAVTELEAQRQSYSEQYDALEKYILEDVAAAYAQVSNAERELGEIGKVHEQLPVSKDASSQVARGLALETLARRLLEIRVRLVAMAPTVRQVNDFQSGQFASLQNRLELAAGELMRLTTAVDAERLFARAEWRLSQGESAALPQGSNKGYLQESEFESQLKRLQQIATYSKRELLYGRALKTLADFESLMAEPRDFEIPQNRAFELKEYFENSLVNRAEGLAKIQRRFQKIACGREYLAQQNEVKDRLKIATQDTSIGAYESAEASVLELQKQCTPKNEVTRKDLLPLSTLEKFLSPKIISLVQSISVSETPIDQATDEEKEAFQENRNAVEEKRNDFENSRSLSREGAIQIPFDNGSICRTEYKFEKVATIRFPEGMKSKGELKSANRTIETKIKDILLRPNSPSEVVADYSVPGQLRSTRKLHKGSPSST
jgi:hypothetical protein